MMKHFRSLLTKEVVEETIGFLSVMVIAVGLMLVFLTSGCDNQADQRLAAENSQLQARIAELEKGAKPPAPTAISQVKIENDIHVTQPIPSDLTPSRDDTILTNCMEDETIEDPTWKKEFTEAARAQQGSLEILRGKFTEIYSSFEWCSMQMGNFLSMGGDEMYSRFVSTSYTEEAVSAKLGEKALASAKILAEIAALKQSFPEYDYFSSKLGETSSAPRAWFVETLMSILEHHDIKLEDVANDLSGKQFAALYKRGVDELVREWKGNKSADEKKFLEFLLCDDYQKSLTPAQLKELMCAEEEPAATAAGAP